jgi:hypothetical protein
VTVAARAIAPSEQLTQDQAASALLRLLDALERGTLVLAVSPDVAARMLDVSRKTLDRLPIPSVHLGHRTRRYPVRALLRYLEERAT